VIDRTPFDLIRRVKVYPPGSCEICHAPIDEHTIEQARRCIALVVDRFCRLGPFR
jgi:hypothetical protein